MIQSFIHILLKRRHFWRYASFNEVSELYASRVMRSMALYMINMFVAIYLYQQGYSLIFITAFYAVSFLFRMAVAYFSARFVAKFGPKHGILVANLIYIPALIAFPLVSLYGIPIIIIFGILQSISMVLFDLSYTVDFSKVKHIEHAGKEIGYMQILERITASFSPLLGGLVAFLFFPEATMILSAVLFVFASAPLFRTKEPVKLNQKLQFKKFPWRRVWRTLRAETAIGFDVVGSNFVWVLFLAVVVFDSMGNDIYLTIGAFASVTIITSFFSAYAFGRIIDWRHGGELLKVASIANSLTHIFRAFVTTPAGVVAANVTNEVATTGYSMAYIRGIFDTADDVPGYRIVYLMFVSIMMNLGCLFAALTLLGLLLTLPSVALAFQCFFVVTAVVVLLAMTARFKLYR